MACPMAFHAAKKVRENMNKPMVAVTESNASGQANGANEWNAKFKFYEAQGGVLARRYNEKMMNAIWGLYNRNSAHNLKSRVDGGEAVAQAAAPAASVMSFDSVAYQISRLTPGLLNHHP
jgi:hypothetical protein